MFLACNTVLFGGFDLATALEHIAYAGFAGAELAMIRGMAEHLRVGEPASHYDQVRALAQAHGLRLVAIEAATDLSKAENRAWLAQVFHVAAALDIPVVTTGSSGTPDPEGFAAAVGWVRELAQVAADAGVTYAVKPHVGAAVYSTATALQLLEAVDSPALKVNYDPTHLYRHQAAEDPVESARRLGSHIGHVHIRDVGSREPRMGPPEVQIAGRGALDLPGCLQALREVGYHGPLTLEIIGAGKHPLSRCAAIAAESRGYLHRCLRELGIAQ